MKPLDNAQLDKKILVQYHKKHLMPNIKMAQIIAGEKAVIDSLKEKGVLQNTVPLLGSKTVSDKDRIWALEKIVAIKEKERQEWADMCIRKQARIEELEKASLFYLDEIGRLSNKVAELLIVDSFREGNGDIA